LHFVFDHCAPFAVTLCLQLPADVYKLLPFALAPIMSNPISMALNDVDSRAPLTQQASDLLYVSACCDAAAAVRHVDDRDLDYRWTLNVFTDQLTLPQASHSSCKQHSLVLGLLAFLDCTSELRHTVRV
jgi:hypothetical protein